MVFSCVTYDFNATPVDVLEVWSCASSCDQQASWSGVTGLLDGDDVTADATIAPDGRVSVAVNLGKQASADLSYRVGYFTCAGNCGVPGSWSSAVLDQVGLYGRRLAIDADETGRLALAINGTVSGTNGLFLSTCAGDCSQKQNWTTTLADDAKRLNATMPENPPSGCTNATWIADRVNGVAFKAGKVVTTSGYGAIGTGGSCFNNLFSPTTAYTYIRSVVSFALGSL